MPDKATLSELAAKADAIIIERGGESDLESATDHVREALEMAEELGFIKLTPDVVVERSK